MINALGYADNAGNHHYFSDETPETQLIEDYKVVQYNYPVSYTHLDVYKRQAMGMALWKSARHAWRLARIFWLWLCLVKQWN